MVRRAECRPAHHPGTREIRLLDDHMSKLPSALSYTQDHVWITEPSEGIVTVGLTAHASDALGDIVSISLPPAGTNVTAGEPCGDVESTKSVNDIYAPVTGQVAAVNHAVEQDPAVINADPYGAAWLFTVRTSDDALGLRLGHSAQLFVRALELFTILSSPGSQVGEPFGEEPPGVWGVWTVICLENGTS
jgi:glycine cleavage system H protein